jgi:NAD(P)H-dependent flavin oxidoreductase YrpB (nitropropane dioxygenase family)
MALATRIVDAVALLPVAITGGIADARGVVAALALGAEAVVLGTRFRPDTLGDSQGQNSGPKKTSI